ncbi:MAG TPA: 3-phosphoshikimate 1-carboxyvinyltransferase [Ruminococcus sp.]|jgi:3-phosphoshikimate 1-carboxyvinyltransferase|nr:3-phosphoshikimate 1-carboxyvinyltransferase [Ruminococcus sp.]
MKVTINPQGHITGTVKAPPSKSMAHRALICAGLAEGKSVIDNIAASEDILATIDCLRALGAEINYDTEAMRAEVKGTDPASRGEASLHCRESGSTLRFMLPLCALSDDPAALTGSRRLMERPLTIYEDIFRSEGIDLDRSGSSIRVKGRLTGGDFGMPGDISSQFVSGLLFTLPLCKEDGLIRLEGKIESRPYIDMTIKALNDFGIEVGWKNETDLAVPGSQRYKANDTTIEGDWSNAANLLALGLEVTGVDPDSLQGDRVCREYFGQLDEGRAELDIADCPDLGPVLMAYAALNHGATLLGTRRLRFKESDRGNVMREELAKCGVDVKMSEDSITVGCGVKAPSQMLSGHNDHRIVMALAAICARTGGSIEGAEAVSKSFPDYFDKLEGLGIEIRKEQ